MTVEPKTKKTNVKPKDFISTVKDEQKRKDSLEVLKMMEAITGEKGAMWGTSIVGFGTTKIKYASGEELDWPTTGFSPRAQALTLYVVKRSSKEQAALLKKLGKHKTGGGCLHIKKLSDVDADVLKKVIEEKCKK
ncbi:MAG: DUF1801 domain-containing protein [Bacteroidetes bacterium]|nr:DUF1801 domain-containing protein [Bacteroidota bacterium]